MGLHRGFKESRDLGAFNLVGLGMEKWNRGSTLVRNVSEMRTDNGLLVLVASCIVGSLVEVAENIGKSDKDYYDAVFYSMALMAASQSSVGRMGRLQSPRYDTKPIFYDKIGDRRAWAILCSGQDIGIGSTTPLLVRIAQSSKSMEPDVMSVISCSKKR
jgi:hypothetical protein